MNEISWENFEKLSEFIYKKTGIYLSKEKHFNKIENLFDRLKNSGKVTNFKDYFTALRFEDSNGVLFEELINSITINETYFFREKHQFEILVNNVLREMINNGRSSIRILSAPCSSGEEPYSIAIYLLEEGRMIRTHDFEIVGIDIDSNCIQKARNGVYRKASLRVLPETMEKKYFTKQEELYELKAEIRDAIDFQRINIFDKSQVRKLGKFDVIFSRNMLIYFDDASQKEVVTTFYDMLNYGSYLFLGHAEYMSRIAPIFKPVRVNNVLVYKKE
ncbi:MAG: CheR family methyltransferase [Helicobacteraceae bacterium]